MKDSYRVIRRTREEVKALKDEGWLHTQIAKHIGISNAMVGDLLEIDEVAMNLRETTIEKFRKFLASQEKKKPKPEPEPEPEEVYPAPEWNDKPPDEPPVAVPLYQWKKVPMPEDLVEQLNEISTKFASKGWRLDCTLTLQKLPE